MAFMLQGRATSPAASYQRPQGIMDVPTFDEELRQASPEVANIIRKHGLFVQDGTVDSSEEKLALNMAEQFPRPSEYVLQNQQNKRTTVSEGGSSRSFDKRLQTGDLVIYYNSQPVSQVSEVLVISEIGLNKASAFLNYVPHRSFGIYLFNSREDRNKVSEYEVHYPNIYVWYSDGDMSLKEFLIHELTHMVEIDYYGRHWCEGTQWSWINEGIADYVGWEYFWNTGSVDLRYNWPPQNLTQVVSCDNWEKYRHTDYSTVYQQAQSVIEYLVETYGRDKVVEILHNFKTGLSPGDALKIRPSAVDPQGDNKGAVQGTDIKSVYVALDDNYLYLAFQLYDGINRQQRVQFCFGMDTNGDGAWEYQPNLDIYGRAWVWNLTQGMDYSNMTKLSMQYEAIAATNEVVEFRMSLFTIGYPKSAWIEPYLVIEHGGQYIAADAANRFHLDMVDNRLPPTTNPLIPDSTITSGTTTSVLYTTTLPTTLETTAMPQTAAKSTTSTQLVTGVVSVDALVGMGVALMIVATVVFYLRRRGK